jgi:hypothetical protein
MVQNTGHTQKNGAVLIVFTIKTVPFFCVCPVQFTSERSFVTAWLLKKRQTGCPDISVANVE